MNENVAGAKTYDELDLPEYQCHKKVKAFKITKMLEVRDETLSGIKTLYLLFHRLLKVPQRHLRKHLRLLI